MKAVIQRVKNARVDVDEKTVGEISEGYLILVGVMDGDTEADARYCAEKIAGLRVFDPVHRPIFTVPGC